MPKLYLIIVFKLEFGSRAKDKVVSELTEEEKNVKALKRWHIDRPVDHNDGQFFKAVEWLMFFFRPPLTIMVFQWF